MKAHRLFLALLLALLTLLGGCASSPWVSGEAREVAELLEYYEKLNGMAADEQRREYTAAQSAFERQSGDQQRLRLALAMLVPRAPWRDDARVLQLLAGLEPVSVDRASPRHELALLLQKLVSERQRLLRDEHKKTEDLQQKLDALRAIDRESRRKPPSR
jgi:hypothetical protein